MPKKGGKNRGKPVVMTMQEFSSKHGASEEPSEADPSREENVWMQGDPLKRKPIRLMPL